MLLELKDAVFESCEVETQLPTSMRDPLFQALVATLQNADAVVLFERSPAVALALEEDPAQIWAVIFDFANGRQFCVTLKQRGEETELVEADFQLTGDWSLRELEHIRTLRLALKALVLAWKPTKIEVKWRA